MKAVIYTRVSTASQGDDGTSLSSQASSCRKYASDNKLDVVDVVEDVYSGAYLHERPGLTRLREGVRSGYYKVVIVHAADRLSRSIAHLMILLDECERYGAELRFVTEPLDATPEGKLLQSVKGYVAEVEREKIRERTMRGRRTHAINGTLSFGRALFGYRVGDNGRRVIDPDEGERVVQQYRDVLAGKSLRSIAAELNERGVQTATGDGVWWPKSVKSLINNPAYCGRTVAFRYKHADRYEDGRRIRNNSIKGDAEQLVVLPNATPAIVTVADWEMAQLAIAERNLKKPGRRPTLEFLLRGFVVCATCGRSFSPVHKRGNYRYYVCTSTQNPSLHCGTRSFPAGEAEQTVWNWVVSVLRDINYKAPKPTAPAVDTTAAIERSMNKLNVEIDRLVKRAATADDDLWPQFEKELTRKQNELRKLAENKQAILRKQQKSRPAESLPAIRKRIGRNLDKLNFEERVQLLKDLRLHCTWDGETLKINPK